MLIINKKVVCPQVMTFLLVTNFWETAIQGPLPSDSPVDKNYLKFICCIAIVGNMFHILLMENPKEFFPQIEWQLCDCMSDINIAVTCVLYKFSSK